MHLSNKVQKGISLHKQHAYMHMYMQHMLKGHLQLHYENPKLDKCF